MARHSNPKCRTCKYKAQEQAINGCDYISIVRHSRGCSVKDCNKYEKGKRLNCSEKWNNAL